MRSTGTLVYTHFNQSAAQLRNYLSSRNHNKASGTCYEMQLPQTNVEAVWWTGPLHSDAAFFAQLSSKLFLFGQM